MSKTPDPKTLHYPRLLCLHGGGVTGEVYNLQMRSVLRDLNQAGFRLVFADGPFLCDAGPGIIPVYEGFGPYRRWLRWTEDHHELDDATAIDEIEASLKEAIREDDQLGADGEWVGLIGFSQGAKITASVLYDQQQRMRDGETVDPQWRFGVVMAGRAPLVSMSAATEGDPNLMRAGSLGDTSKTEWKKMDELLEIPTIHLLGLNDPGLPLHRKLAELYCEPSRSTILEWDGDHRIPFKNADVTMLVKAILRVADETGVRRPVGM